jgi:hypothetical protein
MRKAVREVLRKKGLGQYAHDGALPNESLEDAQSGRMHTLDDIATKWRCSYEMVGKLFKDEPGVIRLGVTYRVPESVLRRVAARLMNP